MIEKIEQRGTSVDLSMDLYLPIKKYTYMEKIVHFWVNIPLCCGIGYTLKSEVAKGKYVCDKLSVAYRAERRNPGEIFEQGFSAYSLYRAFNKHFPFIDELINGDKSWRENLAYLLVPCDTSDKSWLEISILFLIWNTIALPLRLLFLVVNLVILFFSIIFDPQAFFGQSLYKDPFISNWSALALSKEERDANCFLSPASSFWKYVVVLDGYIDFSEYSRKIIADGEDLDPRDMEDCAVYDAGEVLPKAPDNQTISPECILGAYKIVNNKKTEFVYNPNFFGLSKLSKNLDHTQC